MSSSSCSVLPLSSVAHVHGACGSDDFLGEVVNDVVLVLDHAQVLEIERPALVGLVHMVLTVAHRRGLAHQLCLLIEQSVIATHLLDRKHAGQTNTHSRQADDAETDRQRR